MTNPNETVLLRSNDHFRNGVAPASSSYVESLIRNAKFQKTTKYFKDKYHFPNHLRTIVAVDESTVRVGGVSDTLQELSIKSGGLEPLRTLNYPTGKQQIYNQLAYRNYLLLFTINSGGEVLLCSADAHSQQLELLCVASFKFKYQGSYYYCDRFTRVDRHFAYFRRNDYRLCQIDWRLLIAQKASYEPKPLFDFEVRNYCLSAKRFFLLLPNNSIIWSGHIERQFRDESLEINEDNTELEAVRDMCIISAQSKATHKSVFTLLSKDARQLSRFECEQTDDSKMRRLTTVAMRANLDIVIATMGKGLIIALCVFRRQIRMLAQESVTGSADWITGSVVTKELRVYGMLNEENSMIMTRLQLK